MSQAHGLSAISAKFAQARAQKRAVFIPYFPVGFPTYNESLEVLRVLSQVADIVEVGVPFSDPLADGPTIQAASQRALENGTTPHHCIEAVRQLREEGIHTPIMLMGYLNPFIAYGYDQLLTDAVAAGVDGFIVPDLPTDEADEFQEGINHAGLGIAHFVAPTSSPERIRLAASRTRGYIYLVSVTGITGERNTVSADLLKHIAAVRTVSQQPIAVGFGISTPEQAQAVGKIADGIIVGSALVKASQEGIARIRTLAESIQQALYAD
jgi:tryptophan synthase alpha chain